jgi:hypothetical protein
MANGRNMPILRGCSLWVAWGGKHSQNDPFLIACLHKLHRAVRAMPIEYKESVVSYRVGQFIT